MKNSEHHKSGLHHIHHFDDGGSSDGGGDSSSSESSSSDSSSSESTSSSSFSPYSSDSYSAPESQYYSNYDSGIQDAFSNLPQLSSPGFATNGMNLSDLQAMSRAGLGGSDISDNQTVDQAIASMNMANISPRTIGSVLGMLNPGLGAMANLAISGMDLLSGKTTVGQAVTNFGLNQIASALHISPSMLSGIVNQNPGQTLASLAGPVGGMVSTGLGVLSPQGSPNSSLAGVINNALGTSGQGNTSALASALDRSLESDSTFPGYSGTQMASSEPSQDYGSSSGSSDESSLLGSLAASGLGSYALNSSHGNRIPWLDTRPQVLKNTRPLNAAENSQLAELHNIYNQIDPELLSAFADRGVIPAATGGSIEHFAAGGGTCSSCEMWGSLSKYAPKVVPIGSTMINTGPSRRQTSGLASLQQIRPGIGQAGGMAHGGLPEKYREAAPDGHNPEFITGLTGYYANGKGTGQSDDIPAMLHDGDYVMDADTVAALGDGSSKAGALALEGFRHEIPHQMSEGGKAVPAKIADGEYVFPESFVTALGNGDNKRGAKMLDTIRENLRAHKRSAPTSKIPPKALSPLDYLNKSKG